MPVGTTSQRWKEQPRRGSRDPRLVVVTVGAMVAFLCIVVKLFAVQVVQHDWYVGLASGQRELFERLYPERGEIAVHDRQHLGGWFPIAMNEQTFTVYTIPAEIVDSEMTARKLREALGVVDPTLEERLAKRNDPYEPVAREVSASLRDAVLALDLPGVGSEPTLTRVYPDGAAAAHITGFVGEDEEGISGRYGIEGAFDDVLGGEMGFLAAERDPHGRLIVFGNREVSEARDGSDIHLTIERELQLEVCRQLEGAVAEYGAASGTVVIVHPMTGAIRALCSIPSFDPNAYGEAENIRVFSTPAVSAAYEPGSVFKPITMAAAIDAEVVNPETTFVDTGEVVVNGEKITNTNGVVNGLSTMSDVLRYSINTGTVFAARLLGIDRFRRSVEQFGFGARTDIELSGEVPGDIANLQRREEVYLATGSYGQGITATPLQLVMAFAAIANGGTLMRPYIVEEIVDPNGTSRQFEPHSVHRAISQRTATLLQGMLVSVVREGHPKRAGVQGYLIGGKTGTAQIPYADRPGYSNETIQSFVGIGPVDRPTFAMVVRFDRPQRNFADSTAAPLFGSIAKYLVQYDGIPPRSE
ncbi:MAG: penicillin-binding protein 2 [Candidatus Uhrbacteria bacterium]